MADHVHSEPQDRAAPVVRRSSREAGAPFKVLKPEQGIHVRWATAAGAGVLAISGAHFLWSKLTLFPWFADNEYARSLVPVAVLLLMAYLIFWVVGRKESIVDFLIATEGEMKKVNWSTRREVWGATRVVIFTVLALGILLFVVDIIFMAFFGSIGVLKNIRILETFFGGAS